MVPMVYIWAWAAPPLQPDRWTSSSTAVAAPRPRPQPPETARVSPPREPASGRAGLQAEVDEPGTGDRRLLYAGGVDIHARDEIPGDVLRLATEGARQRHRQICRPVAERRITRSFDGGFDRVRSAKRTRRPDQGVANDRVRCHSTPNLWTMTCRVWASRCPHRRSHCSRSCPGPAPYAGPSCRPSRNR